MKKHLVVVESPNKIKSIEKYLGKDYEVQASVGHIVYLPASGYQRLGVDIRTWTPNYKIDPDKKEVVKKLKAASDKAEMVLIATDPDREGEAIADNLVNFLDIQTKYKRIRFNEITEDAVKAAVANPTEIDADLVKSQIARRILDRVIGFKLSKLMRNKITSAPNYPSAGRVQSIALKLVIEREKEIQIFVPEVYHLLSAVIDSKKDIVASYIGKKTGENKDWINADEIEAIRKALTKKAKVAEIKISQRRDSKTTPLKQSALYKKADSALNMSSKSVQRAAQRLYEGYGDGGLISYPRTDSTRMSDTFVKNAQAYIAKMYGKEYVAEDIKGSAGAQDAHEAIRPTSLNLTPAEAKTKFNLESSEANLYELIYLHTLQALMTPALREITRYILVDAGYEFGISESKVLFDGFLRVEGYKEQKSKLSFTKNQIVDIENYNFEKHETQPPARYNDGSLIEKLDEIGVGRPSTFATTVNILSERLYVEKNGKALVPTDFGNVVYEKLTSAFPDIMNVQYTARVEKELDEIAHGKFKYEKVLDDFWQVFEKSVLTATQELDITRVMPKLAGKKCPECGAELIVRHNRRTGDTFFGCSNYPTCKHAEPDPNNKKKFKFFKKKPATTSSAPIN